MTIRLAAALAVVAVAGCGDGAGDESQSPGPPSRDRIASVRVYQHGAWTVPVEAAISSAHENGEWIGGNVFGLGNDPPVPPGADYLAVQDFDFKVDLAEVRALAKQIPISFHLGNAPQDPKSDGCRFMNELSTAEREAYVTTRAKQQAANDFRFAYPVLFPECEFSDGGILSFNAITDGTMVPTMKRLMDRYNATTD